MRLSEFPVIAVPALALALCAGSLPRPAMAGGPSPDSAAAPGSSASALDGAGPVLPSRSTNDFCGDPYEAVCSGYDLMMADQVRRVREAGDAIRAKGPGALDELRARSRYNLLSAESVRADLKKAIVWVAPASMIGRMTGIVDATRIIGADEALSAPPWNGVRRKYFELCGPDGMVNNSDAGWVDGDRYVFICAGSLLAARFDPAGDAAANAESAAGNILWSLGHELGHHLGAPVTADDDLDALDAPFLRCLKEGFAGSYRDENRGEAIADYWAAETTAQRLISAGEDDGRKLLILRQSWGKLCETGGGGVHPSGRMRIEVLLRLNPEVSRAMGCGLPQAPEPPGCGLDGMAR